MTHVVTSDFVATNSDVTTCERSPTVRQALHNYRRHRFISLNYIHELLQYMFVGVSNIDMRRLTTGIRSEKCVVRRLRRCANVIECTYTNLDSTVQPTTHLGYMVLPIALRLQTFTACYCTEYCRQL